MNLTTKEQKLYQAFISHLPVELCETIDSPIAKMHCESPFQSDTCEHIEIDTDPLPIINAKYEARAVLAALKEAFDDIVPENFNPYHFATQQESEAMDYLYLSCIFMLSDYFRVNNNYLSSLPQLLFLATRQKSDNASPYEHMISQIKYGWNQSYDSMCSARFNQASNFLNYRTSRYVRDFKHDRCGAIDAEYDPTFSNYQHYYSLLNELKSTESTRDIAACCRLPFDYVGTSSRLVNEGHLSTEEAELMKTDLIISDVNNLQKVYQELLDNNVNLGLFQQLQIESLFAFINDARAPKAQKQKYLSKLKATLTKAADENKSCSGTTINLNEFGISAASAALRAYAKESGHE